MSTLRNKKLDKHLAGEYTKALEMQTNEVTKKPMGAQGEYIKEIFDPWAKKVGKDLAG